MQEDYIKAKRLGQKEYQKAMSHGDYPYLPVLDDILAGDVYNNEIPVGLMEIPIDFVVGTKTAGRTNAFARNFMPLFEPETEFAMKWNDLYVSQVKEGIRDAIKVYEYMHRFYVQEGNKRVSVSKYVNTPTVLANVTRIIPRQNDSQEYQSYQQFLEFFESCPIYDIEITARGGYKKLAEAFGYDLGKKWPEEAIKALRTSYQLFDKTYRKVSKGRINITSGDALLIYAQLYPIESIKELGTQALIRRIGKIWNEILINENDDNIAVIDENVELSSKNNIKKLFNAVVTNYTKEKPFKAAFFYERDPSTSNWLYGHELGRNYIEDNFDGIVETSVYTDCNTDEELSKAVDNAIEWGADICFTVSPKHMPETMRCALHYPKVKFMNCSINLSSSNVRTYYGRMYEAKFLLGALAASLSKGKNIGYLASYPIYGQAAEINAFAIGAALINPDVKVVLKWSSQKDMDFMKEFKEEGIDLISGPDLIMPNSASREFGLFRIMPDDSIINLALPVSNWGVFYQRIISSIMEADWDDATYEKDKATNYYLGMASGVIDVILSGKISYYSRKQVESLRLVLLKGLLNPFDGEIHSQNGVIKVEGDPSLTYEEIVSMDWLNDNVIGRFPKKEELKTEALETINISGLLKLYQ
ncbi:MAG: BMP family ABC transporter substrate-binding protein [Lachnospiraceae bacterium]|nr:BMP family ABC transporter substrate-binding protein [Lachnospiraceae bacterium]